MSADMLSVPSRNFYENIRLKVAFSMSVFAGSLLLMGLCTSAGGQSSAANYVVDSNSTDDGGAYALAGGYGFASFCYILGFVLLVVAALYISPLTFGSNNEKKMLKSPQEIDTGYSEDGAVSPV
jgi:hypothetical protein